MQMSILKKAIKFIYWPCVARLFRVLGFDLERRALLSGSTNRTNYFLIAALVVAFLPNSISLAQNLSDQAKVPATLTRADVDKLLVQARSAMASGKLEQADAILRRAEASKVRYPMLHFGDTPTRVRTELAKMPGGEKFAASQTVQDPFAAAELLAASAQPLVGSTPSVPSSNTKASTANRQMSDAALLAARQALAVGDIEKAKQFLRGCEKARS